MAVVQGADPVSLVAAEVGAAAEESPEVLVGLVGEGREGLVDIVFVVAELLSAVLVRGIWYKESGVLESQVT